MTAGPVAQGGTLTLTVFFRTGTGTLIDPVNPLVSILDPVGDVAVGNVAPTTHPSVGTFTYDFAAPVDAALGSWTAHWTGSISGSAEEADESFLVVPAGSIGFGTTCGDPWFDPADVSGLDGLSDEDALFVATAASDMLYAVSGRQFGICEESVRPASVSPTGGAGDIGSSRAADGSAWLGFSGTANLPESTWGFGGGGDLVSGGMLSHSAVLMPHLPIVDIIEILLDGTAMPAGSWRIVDNRWVVRADGLSWPIAQRLDLPLDSAGTWSIRYSFGNPIPPGGVLAARVLATELSKSLLGDSSCRLPKRLTSLTREGVTAVVMDPFTFLDKGRFDIYEIDSWLNVVNPAGLRADAKVINVDLLNHTPRLVR